VISGWAWEGTAANGGACGISDNQQKAKFAARDWLIANPDGEAVLSPACLADGTTTLSAFWARTGHPRQSRRTRDGRITWARVPAARQRAAG
jgi:hypothetical protein